MCAVFDHHRWQTIKEGEQKVLECQDCHRRDPPNGPHPYSSVGAGGGGGTGAYLGTLDDEHRGDVPLDLRREVAVDDAPFVATMANQLCMGRGLRHPLRM